MKPYTKLSSNKGTTLLEFIVVIAIMGIVSLLIFGFMDFGLRSLFYGAGQVEDQANLRLVALEITETIRNASDLDLLGDDSYTKEIFLDVDNSIKYDDGGGSPIKLSDNLIGAVNFELRPQMGKSLLMFELTSLEGDTLSSEVLLNNISGTTETGTVIEFELYP